MDHFGPAEHSVERRGKWRDERLIDITDANEIAFWTKTLDVTVIGLLIAMDSAGATAHAVRRFLSRRSAPRPISVADATAACAAPVRSPSHA